MEKKRRMHEEHAERLAAARREQALRTQQVRQRTMRHFNTDSPSAEAKPAVLNMPETIVEDKPVELDADAKTFLELDQFSSKAFESQIVDDKTPNEFLKQFIFNEPLIITASCFDRVDWDGDDEVASPKAAYQSPATAATPGASSASSSPAPKQKERAISSTGVYDWKSDPNAFPEGAFADTLPEGKDEDESKADAQADTSGDLTLYDTVKSDYSDAFDSDDEDPSSSTTVMADKAEALQNIRDAGIAMSKPFTPKTPMPQQESPQRRGQGRLQAELYHMRHDALKALGRSEFNRLHTLMLERWKSGKALNHDALLELAKGDEKVGRHLENLLHLITVEEMMKQIA